MKYVEPEMEIVELDTKVFTELTSGIDTGNPDDVFEIPGGSTM